MFRTWMGMYQPLRVSGKKSKPSGVWATYHTNSVCPTRGLLTTVPFSAFQIRIVLSWDPETVCRPSREWPTEYRHPVCPSRARGLPTVAPVSASWLRMVLSLYPEVMYRPSGESPQCQLLDCRLQLSTSRIRIAVSLGPWHRCVQLIAFAVLAITFSFLFTA